MVEGYLSVIVYWFRRFFNSVVRNLTPDLQLMLLSISFHQCRTGFDIIGKLSLIRLVFQ